MEDVVSSAISALINQGKQPSVALIKAHVSKSVPMPVIIDVLARFKQNPNEFKGSNSSPLFDDTDKSAPSSQLDRIEAKLDKLIALLESN